MNFDRLVFPDFDGVMHPGLAGTFIYLPDFEDFLAQYENVGVVLSTSWREQYPIEELRALFRPSLRERVIGMTPVFGDAPGVRYSEILSWIAANRFAGGWAALDDDTSLFPAFCERLVVCNPARGLRRAQLDELRVKLQLPAIEHPSAK